MQIHSQIQSAGSHAHPVLQEKASPPAGRERASLSSAVSATRGEGAARIEGKALPRLRDTLLEIQKVLRDELRDRPRSVETEPERDRVRDRVVDRPLPNTEIGTGVEIGEPRLRDEPLAVAPGSQQNSNEAFLRQAGENILNLLKELKSRTPEWFTLGRTTPTPAPTGAPLSSTTSVESAAAGEGSPATVAPGEASTSEGGNGGSRGRVLREVGQTVVSLLAYIRANAPKPGAPIATSSTPAGLSSSTAVEGQSGAEANAVQATPQQPQATPQQPQTGLANNSLPQQAGENLVALLKKLQNELSPSTYGPTPVKSSTLSVSFNFFNVVT